MERQEVSALLSPSRRRSQASASGSSAATTAPPREEIVLDASEEDAFLRALEERLQQRVQELERIDLVLGAKQINYLAFRLHEALEPKPDPETSIIHAWTIQPQAQLKVKTGSHIQVLKLSTILREVQRLRVHKQSVVRSPIELEIFPSLRSFEIVHTEPVALRNVHFFAGQLRQLRIEHTPLENLAQVLCPVMPNAQSGGWTCLDSIRINCCALPVVDRCFNKLEAVKVADLSWNEIVTFETRIECPSLQWFDLCHNQLTAIPDLSTLKVLKVLDLSKNYIKSLRGIDHLSALMDFNISRNLLDQIAEVETLIELKQLRRLVMTENPIACRPDYRREVLFFLGENVEVDDEPWTSVELQTMKTRRRLHFVHEDAVTLALRSWSTAALGGDISRTEGGAVMGYPQLPRRGIRARPAEIIPPPRMFSPTRRSLPTRSTSMNTKLGGLSERNGARASAEGTTTELTEELGDVMHGTLTEEVSVDDFFRVHRDRQVGVIGSKSEIVQELLDAEVDYDSDSDGSATERSRNRSRKYTESDFMRDFEEEMEVHEGGNESSNSRSQRSTSFSKRSSRQQLVAGDAGVEVRVLLSAEDAAVFDLAFGIDGLAATVRIKANEILETVNAPDREFPISFSRRLPDVVAIGTSTHSTRANLVLLKLRRLDQSFGSVTYQIETTIGLSRVLTPLLGHLYNSTTPQVPHACACSNCGGISHFTSEYEGAIFGEHALSEAVVLRTCLICASLNVRDVSPDRMLSLYVAEGISSVGRRIKPAATSHALSEVGFVLEEQAHAGVDESEVRECVMVSMCGIREVAQAHADEASETDIEQ